MNLCFHMHPCFLTHHLPYLLHLNIILLLYVLDDDSDTAPIIPEPSPTSPNTITSPSTSS